MAVRSAMLVLALMGVTLITLERGGRTQEPKGDAADRVKVVRATYEPVPPTILKLTEPIHVQSCTHQASPVYINLLVIDADGFHHSFNWRLDRAKVQNAEFDRINWTRYKQPPGPIGQNTYRLSVRGPEEAALYGLMLRWAAGQEKLKDLSRFDKIRLEEVTELLEKLDNRFAAEKPLPQKW